MQYGCRESVFLMNRALLRKGRNKKQPLKMYMMFIAAKRSNDTYIGPLVQAGKKHRD